MRTGRDLTVNPVTPGCTFLWDDGSPCPPPPLPFIRQLHTNRDLSFQTYAKFSGAPLKVHKLSNPWRSPSGTCCAHTRMYPPPPPPMPPDTPLPLIPGQLPALKTPQDGVVFQTSDIITHLRKQVSGDRETPRAVDVRRDPLSEDGSGITGVCCVSRNITQITTCPPKKEPTPWPSSLCWRRGYCPRW